ncbi:MAG TPA: hypothetical protein VD886_03265 [Herpetosiphonaceae bacterium]|nr:hypothetical protein [Herpetosiphonaceae bacterium]
MPSGHVWDEYCDQYQSDWESDHPAEPWERVEEAYRFGWEASCNPLYHYQPYAIVEPILAIAWRLRPQPSGYTSWASARRYVRAGWDRAADQFGLDERWVGL